MMRNVNLAYLIVCISIFCILPMLSMKMGTHTLIQDTVWAAIAFSYPIAVSLIQKKIQPWKYFGRVLLTLSVFQIMDFAIYFIRENGYQKPGDFSESSIFVAFIVSGQIILASLFYWLGYGLSRLLLGKHN